MAEKRDAKKLAWCVVPPFAALIYTAGMRTLPLIAVLLGAAGLIPFVAGSLGAVTFQGDLATRSLLALQAYSAVILGFLGGVHWGIGLEVGINQSVRAQRLRFGLGVVPGLVGWAGLLVTFLGLPLVGLAIQAAGFIGLTIAEARGTHAGLVPRPYMALRWALSIVVILCLVSVLIVLAFGGHVVI